MQKPFYLAALAVALPAVANATDSRFTGQIQVQGNYQETDGEDGKWSLATRHSWLGIEAVEAINGTRYVGVAEADVDPLEDSASARQFYLGLEQALYEVRAGRITTLEYNYLAEPVSLMQGTGADSSAVGQYLDPFADRLVQLELSSREAGFFAAEWQLEDEDASDTLAAWTVVTGLYTAEGQASLSYHQDETQDAGRWGLSLRWADGPWALSAAYLFREDPLAWDIGVDYQTGQIVSKFAYGQDETPGGVEYWSAGFEQLFTVNVNNFFEVRWQPEDEILLGQVGFQLRL
ncbi:porin [Saccharospirillum mangrovi]|uniref:porin n=1 Tax=Saccharospirillum mangrovi TaxID=2161747 RepID=UPI000D39CD41|nr:porin [Saccharospirillum mangrovi]